MGFINFILTKALSIHVFIIKIHKCRSNKNIMTSLIQEIKCVHDTNNE